MLTIILPVYNQYETVQNYFNCLDNQTYKDIFVLLIDNGNDDTYKRLNTNTNYLPILENCYWGESLQKAYEWLQENKLKSNYLMISNCDIVFSQYFIEQGMSQIKYGQLLTANIYQGQNKINGGIEIDWKKYKFSFSDKPNCTSTRALFMTMFEFLGLDGFRPKLLPHYLSNYEFTYRTWKKGFKIKEDKSLVAYSVDKDPNKSKRRIFSKKNPANPYYQTIFVLMHCPIKYKLLNICKIWAYAVYNQLHKWSPD